MMKFTRKRVVSAKEQRVGKNDFFGGKTERQQCHVEGAIRSIVEGPRRTLLECPHSRGTGGKSRGCELTRHGKFQTLHMEPLSTHREEGGKGRVRHLKGGCHKI